MRQILFLASSDSAKTVFGSHQVRLQVKIQILREQKRVTDFSA